MNVRLHVLISISTDRGFDNCTLEEKYFFYIPFYFEEI